MTTRHGFCECGCGERTRQAPITSRAKGWTKGQPIRFVKGHAPRVNSPFKAGHTINVGRTLVFTDAHRAALSAANVGKKASTETRAAMRAGWAAKDKATVQAHVARASAAARLASQDEVVKLRKAERQRKAWFSKGAEERAVIVAARNAGHRKHWASLSPDERHDRTETQRLLATVASTRTRPTSIEVTVAAVLEALDVPYKSQVSIGRYVVDFIIPDRRLVIECDGDYWHSLPHVKVRDARRDKWLNSQGYKVLRLFERAIRRGSAHGAIRAILEVA